MELVKDTPMEVGWLVWSPNRGRTAITVAVKATFDLPEDGVAELAAEQRPLTGDEHHDDDIERSLRWASDLELLKPQGECWVVGSFHAPHGLPVDRSVAAFSVGAVGKQLAVSGDRVWRTGGAGEAAEITSLPLTWERAFGGPGFDANPVGRGLVGRELPNVEDPAALVQSSDQRPRPAGFAPLPRAWKVRSRHAGTYDQRWLAERYPSFADDLDYRYFLCAPEDQRVAGFWQGDEEIRLRHLHPLHASLRAQLPGMRAQAFLVRGGELTDVGLRLDTIAIDADAGQAVCVWRGVADVKDDAASDVDELFVVHQRPDDRQQLADYAAWFQNALDGKLREDEDPDAEAQAAPPSAAGGAAAEVEEEQPFVDPEAPGAKWAHLDQAMTVRGDDSALAASLAQELERRRAEEKSAAFRPVFDDALGIEAPPSVERVLSPEEQLALEMELALGELADDPTSSPERERVRDAVRAGESCAGWQLAGVDLSGASLVGADFTGANLTGANLSGAFIRDAKLDGAILGGAELSDAVLEQCSLVEADMTPSRAERLRLAQCDLRGAHLNECYLRAARFSACDLRGTELSESDLAEATFDDCNLDGADLSRSELGDARFSGCTLVDTWAEGVVAPGLKLDKCDCSLLRASEGASLEGASFKQAKLDGARFADAKLRGADFSLASLDRADFSGAMLSQARLMGCRLRAARFDGAVLVQASMMKADLFQARFEGANLKHADLRGANLYQAELFGAELRDARLELAYTHGTRLE